MQIRLFTKSISRDNTLDFVVVHRLIFSMYSKCFLLANAYALSGTHLYLSTERVIQ